MTGIAARLKKEIGAMPSQGQQLAAPMQGLQVARIPSGVSVLNCRKVRPALRGQPSDLSGQQLRASHHADQVVQDMLPSLPAGHRYGAVPAMGPLLRIVPVDCASDPYCGPAGHLAATHADGTQRDARALLQASAGASASAQAAASAFVPGKHNVQGCTLHVLSRQQLSGMGAWSQ